MSITEYLAKLLKELGYLEKRKPVIALHYHELVTSVHYKILIMSSLPKYRENRQTIFFFVSL
jgi:hypothetical protein